MPSRRFSTVADKKLNWVTPVPEGRTADSAAKTLENKGKSGNFNEEICSEKSRARIIVPSEDSLKWRAGLDTTRHTWRPSKTKITTEKYQWMYSLRIKKKFIVNTLLSRQLLRAGAVVGALDGTNRSRRRYCTRTTPQEVGGSKGEKNSRVYKNKIQELENYQE
jgi:hypothetical protein